MNGSLSQFIVEETVGQQLDEEFNKVKDSHDEEDWETYFDDCHFYLLKAVESKAKISFDGAISIIIYYYEKVISTSEDDIQVYKCIHLLEQILTMCAERSRAEMPEWYQQLFASLATNHIFLPALTHKQEQVRLFSVRQIHKFASSPHASELAQQPQLLLSVVSLLSQPLTVAAPAQDTLVALCSCDAGLMAVFTKAQMLQAMKNIIADKGLREAKYNVYEVVVRVCILGGDQLSVISNSGLLDQLVGELNDSNDVLGQLVILQQVAQLVRNDAAMHHLSKAGLLQRLQEALLSAAKSSESSESMALPGMLKVFGAMGQQPELLHRSHRAVVECILEMAGGGVARGLQIIALETLGEVAATVEGKIIMQDNHGGRQALEAALLAAGRGAVAGAVADRGRFISILIRLLSLPPDQRERVNEDNRLNTIISAWYSSVFSCDSLAPLRRLVLLPFPDIHCVAYELLAVVLSYPWGVTMLDKDNAMLFHLLDRSTEHNKEDKDAKFAVITALLSKPSRLREVLGDHATRKVQAYHLQGPYYVQPYMEVGVGIEHLAR